MTTAMIFTALIPVAVALALGAALLGARLEPTLRTRVERVVAAIVYPLFAAFWIWRALIYLDDDNLLMACVMAVLAGFFAVEGVKAFRRGRVIASRQSVPS
ncbi:hypothetical protein [uncultured Brevundimonas sp.]|uniref:hypothetical protein n=1 Tax=uncultured Brevundimonas sp. TaxID=213418 RepID=UPI0030EE77E0|tara:strand:+ start:276 stop:578 length:303 start_codon:yes stop_codon:yes gene_type:complete